ncbi:membrane protein [Spirochaetia bacterium]|nr:membrane protein [Spirochaetia bacterium]
MLSFFYTLIIFPLVQLLELVYVFAYRIFDNPGIAIIAVSAAVSICTLPLYMIAEKHQQTERDIQAKLKPKTDKIKAVFKGDEQYLILSAYYRQNHYHPVYALRNSVGLLIQIPFFISAYSYLSHLSDIQGFSFLFIKDMGSPDALITTGSLSIHFLPIVMTIINCISGTVYTKGLPLKDKVQVYGTALIFLLLLYNSPSGLVFYWTLNNIFSLLKNILYRMKNRKKIIYAIVFTLALIIDIYVLFFHSGSILKRILVFMLVSFLFFMPHLAKLGKYIDNRIQKIVILNKSTFFFSVLILFLLTGLVVPSLLASSSVEEFSFIDTYTTPFPFILHAMLQAAGIFLFWPACIYFLFSDTVKRRLTLGMTFLCVIALVNTFFIPETFGFFTVSLVFSEPKPFSVTAANILLNTASIMAVILFFLFVFRKRTILYSFHIIAVISLMALTVYNFYTIGNIFSRLQTQRQSNFNNQDRFNPVYSFSQTGKNVLVILLDRAISGYVPYLFDEKPELLSSFQGFTWYPNCVSFAGHTLVGATTIYGGYEYAPVEINRRSSVSIFDKHQEAYLMLPRLFSEYGYTVTVTDPPFDNDKETNVGIYNRYPLIHAENITGKYTSLWLQEHPNITGLSIPEILRNNIIRFSFYKISLQVFRYYIYDDGHWLTTDKEKKGGDDIGGSLTPKIIDSYAVLDSLVKLTKIEERDINTFTLFYNALPHDPVFLQTPDYTPAEPITGNGSKYFKDENLYHVNMASFLLLEKWFNYLAENDVYDNTRIIIVSDHGANISSPFPDNIVLPNGVRLEAFNALLMVKDFNSKGPLVTDNSFMTNADTPLLAVNNIINNPVNPFTHIPLKSDKADGVTITTIGAKSSRGHSKYKYSINTNEWLHVKDNIFDSGNWENLSLR